MSDFFINSGTVTGPYHQKNNKMNQDSFYSLQENGYTVIAVSDGAGSHQHSEIGSQIAVSTSVNEAMDSLIVGKTPEEAIRKSIEITRKVLLDRDDVHEIGCTLIIAAITDDNGWFIGAIGDSFAIVTDLHGEHLYLEPEKASEYANITELITSKKYNPLFYGEKDDIASIALSSDGLYDLSINNNDKTPTTGFWNPVIKKTLTQEFNIQSFLYYLEDNDKITDDTTLIIASKNITNDIFSENNEKLKQRIIKDNNDTEENNNDNNIENEEEELLTIDE